MAKENKRKTCKRKKPHATKRAARKAAKRMAAARRCPIRVYQCKVCGKFHLTSVTNADLGDRLLKWWPKE